MPQNSPPKHRHDGTSPLPLGMDWSPPPKKWDGRNTVWPHNPHTGWSYCVMIPSWTVKTDPGASHDSFLNPIVFYRIHIGIQSPQGVSSSHGIFRRFSDFLKLYSALRNAFPKKDIPPAPPKHAFSRINSSRMLLEERRLALEEWMGKLLSDIDLSRSAPLASFLELEAAARSSFRDANDPLETSSSGDAIAMVSSIPLRPSSSASIADSSKVASKPHFVASDMGSDVYETSDLGTPRQGKDQISDSSIEDLTVTHYLTAPRGAFGNGILGESNPDQPEEFLKNRLHHKREKLVLQSDSFDVTSKETFLSRERLESPSEQDHDKLSGHTRKLSSESTGSDISSMRGSELSVTGMTNSIWDGSVDLPSGSEVQNSMEALSGLETHVLNDAQIVLPLDQRHKLNRILVTMARRLGTAKTDMEDLLTRLNQETAVKDYLTTKVRDLEVELEVTKQKAKENLQQAILVERERVTQMQWDMDELHRKYSEMESRLKIEYQNEKTCAESEKTTASGEKELLLQELDTKREELETMQKGLEELEMKSKADIKVLVKEVKLLRSSQAELRKMLNQYLTEKTELERVARKEKQRRAHAKSARRKLLNECIILHDRLQECSVNFLSESEDRFTINPSSLSDALDLLATSDNRISLLLEEAQLLARDEEQTISDADEAQSSESSENLSATNGENLINEDNEIRKMLTDIFIDNARLRKQVNSVIRCALNTVVEPEKEDCDEVPSRKTVHNRLLER